MQTYNELEIVMSLPKSKATAPLRKMQNIALNPFYNIQYLQHFFKILSLYAHVWWQSKLNAIQKCKQNLVHVNLSVTTRVMAFQ